MIITLVGANFADSNIGTLSSWLVSRVLGDGAIYTGPLYVEKDSALNATVTLDKGYNIGSSGIVITMGGNILDESYYSIEDNVITFSISQVTGNVVIKVPTVYTEAKNVYTLTIIPSPSHSVVTLTADGYTQVDNSISVIEGTNVSWKVEAENHISQQGTHTVIKDEIKTIILESANSTETIIGYNSRQSSSGISKSTGEYLSSTTGYVNIYDGIDPTKSYAATSYAPASTGDNACVCYYTSDGTFISAESGSDWGISSAEYTMQELTVPSNTSTIKLFGRTNNQEAELYLTSAIVMDEVDYSSQQTNSNLNKATGEYGSSSTGYVNIYDNIDASKTYYGSGFCPNATGTAAAVCYYTSDGTFISAQDGNDFGKSSAGFVKQKLTVPSTASTIRIFAQSASAYPNEPAAALYVERA